MNIRLLILTCLLMAITSYADNTLTVRNSDTGDSFDVSVPDGIKIQMYEYNSEWLDSVPYLLEHARWKEPWAFEALADCYRHGKGGVEKNQLNALFYYDEADIDVSKKAEMAYEADPYDEFGLINHIMENLVNGNISEEDVKLLLADRKVPQVGWIGFLREILSHEKEDRIKYIESQIRPEITSDELFIGVVFLAKYKGGSFKDTFLGDSDDSLQKARFIAGKLPPIYMVLADKSWSRYYDIDTQTGEKYRKQAIEYMYLADQAGLLSKIDMARLLTYCEENGITDLPPFSKDDLDRFEILCPKEYRDKIYGPVVVEEVVEEVVVEEDNLVGEGIVEEIVVEVAE